MRVAAPAPHMCHCDVASARRRSACRQYAGACGRLVGGRQVGRSSLLLLRRSVCLHTVTARCRSSAGPTVRAPRPYVLKDFLCFHLDVCHFDFVTRIIESCCFTL